MTTLQGWVWRPRSVGWGVISQSGGGAEAGLQLSPEAPLPKATVLRGPPPKGHSFQPKRGKERPGWWPAISGPWREPAGELGCEKSWGVSRRRMGEGEGPVKRGVPAGPSFAVGEVRSPERSDHILVAGSHPACDNPVVTIWEVCHVCVICYQ